MTDRATAGTGTCRPRPPTTRLRPHGPRLRAAAHLPGMRRGEGRARTDTEERDMSDALREWRVGRHYGIHVYEDDRPVATFHDADDAERAVIAVNAWRRATTGDPTEPLPLAMQARDLLVRNRELEATVARVRELAEEWSADADARYAQNRIAKSTAARGLREALDGDQ